MRLAWFTPTDGVTGADGFDSTPLIAALGARHEIDVVDAVRAHDFVWAHARRPYDLAIYDLAGASAHDFVWAYPCHYPGLLRLPGDTLRTSRAALRVRDRREQYRVPGTPPPDADALRPFVMASRIVVVPDAYLARALAAQYPGSRVRHALVGIRAVKAIADPARAPRVGVRAGARVDAVRRAVQRAMGLGVALEFAVYETADDLAAHADIVVSAAWPPPSSLPLDALAGLSAGRAVVVLETETTATLPCLDPQTWRPRGGAPRALPAAVSADPRDEEHSLMLALARLAGDADLRSELGAAGRAWWAANASIERSADAWHVLITDAVRVDPASCSYGRPSGALDGSERARAILAECGAAVDFLT